MHTSEEETKAEPDSNPNTNLTLPVKRNDDFHDDFHCLYEGKFLGELEMS